MKIRTSLFFLALVGLSALSALAQSSDDEEDRRVQFSVGYSFQRKDGDKTISRRVFGSGESNKSLNGLNTEGTYYFTRSLGITGNFSTNFDSDKLQLPAGTPSTVARQVKFKERTYNLMAGPQFRFLNSSRFTPFARILFGSQTTQTRLEGLTGTNSKSKFNRTNFAMAVGGGLDVRVNKNFAIRAIQVDYLPSFERRDTVNIFGTTQAYRAQRVDQLRIGFGVVFK